MSMLVLHPAHVMARGRGVKVMVGGGSGVKVLVGAMTGVSEGMLVRAMVGVREGVH